MLVRELAMFFGGRCMVLGLIVLAARVVMLGLMVVMRRRMVVAGCGVMMLLRRVFCHLSVLPLLRIGLDRWSIGRQLPLTGTSTASRNWRFLAMVRGIARAKTPVGRQPSRSSAAAARPTHLHLARACIILRIDHERCGTLGW